jgi:hypothetical protein
VIPLHIALLTELRGFEEERVNKHLVPSGIQTKTNAYLLNEFENVLVLKCDVELPQ